MGRIDKELLNYHSKYSKDGVLINKLKISKIQTMYLLIILLQIYQN